MIKKQTIYLETRDKEYLFDRYETPTQWPFALNLFVGLGTGSMLQGDKTGATVSVIGEPLSLFLTFAPILFPMHGSGGTFGPFPQIPGKSSLPFL